MREHEVVDEFLDRICLVRHGLRQELPGVLSVILDLLLDHFLDLFLIKHYFI